MEENKYKPPAANNYDIENQQIPDQQDRKKEPAKDQIEENKHKPQGANSYMHDIEDMLFDGPSNLYPLHEACRLGHFQKVWKLLMKGSVEVNKTNPSGDTALHCASSHFGIVEQLLHHNTAVNVTNKMGTTPFHEASSNGHEEVVQVLCKHNADVNVVDRNGKTPLTDASYNGHKNIVHVLSDYKADVNKKLNSPNEDSEFIYIKRSILKLPYIQPPLMSAVMMDHDEIVEHLLIKGAHVNVPNSEGWTELHMASYNGHLSIVQKLVKHGADVDAVTDMGATALCIASQEGHTDIAFFLLKNGVDVNHTQSDGATPIILASQWGHSQVVDVLMKHQATTTANLNGQATSATNLALQSRHPHIALKLFFLHTPLTKDDPTVLQLLILASFYGETTIVKTLLLIGVRADAMWNQTTPLMAAVYGGHIDVLQLLIASGVDLFQISKSWVASPLIVAVGENRPDIVDFILYCLKDRQRDIINMVFEPHNFTLLGLAVLHKNPSIVNILCEKGANVNVILKGQTPLFYAVFQNDCCGQDPISTQSRHRTSTRRHTTGKSSFQRKHRDCSVTNRPWRQCKCCCQFM
jgi:serine/threonine-protein phosphatase 6 regulatory ankyrin repeat subunit B